MSLASQLRTAILWKTCQKIPFSPKTSNFDMRTIFCQNSTSTIGKSLSATKNHISTRVVQDDCHLFIEKKNRLMHQFWNNWAFLHICETSYFNKYSNILILIERKVETKRSRGRLPKWWADQIKVVQQNGKRQFKKQSAPASSQSKKMTLLYKPWQ